MLQNDFDIHQRPQRRSHQVDAMHGFPVQEVLVAVSRPANLYHS